MTKPTWPKMTRIAWLRGGLVAVSNPGPEVQIGGGLGGPVLGTLHLPAFGSLYAVLQQHYLRVIGVSFIQTREEAEGIYPPEFRAMSPGWLATETRIKWRQIAVTAPKRNEMLLMEVAARMAGAVAHSEMRLLDLAQAYSVQLRSHLQGERTTYARFHDLNSGAVYKAIHALFWEMAVWRDTIAEFVGLFCLHRTRIASLAGLLSSLKKEPSSDPMINQLVDAGDEEKGGWLALFSAYRNVFTHRAPLNQVAGIAYAIQDTRVISATLDVPEVRFPLPKNAMELSRRPRWDGPLFSSFDELIEASSGKQRDAESEPDALDYLFDCFGKMVKLSDELVAGSPVAPEPLVIPPEDIIGEIRFTRPGAK